MDVIQAAQQGFGEPGIHKGRFLNGKSRPVHSLPHAAGKERERLRLGFCKGGRFNHALPHVSFGAQLGRAQAKSVRMHVDRKSGRLIAVSGQYTDGLPERVTMPKPGP